ncbi:MAG: hypothetical protein CME68_06795 [Halobacteriovoraceae bacterium]|nr:hypothetical protein [Halobacteriovoraceae bacterium]
MKQKNLFKIVIFFLVFLSQSGYSLTRDEAKHLLSRTRFFYSKKDLWFFMKLDKLKAARIAIGAYQGNQVKESIPNFLVELRRKKKKMIKALRTENWSDFNREFLFFYNKYLEGNNKFMMITPLPETKMSKREARRMMRKIQRFFYPWLKKWWIKKMLYSKEPFREVLTLFWHNHFTTSFKAVKDLNLLYQQNELWREKALGSFGDLTRAAVYDPALGLYLDLPKSKRNKPNENLARELFELFTLGIGNYSERDIKEASKALTGFRYNRLKDIYLFKENFHDSSNKFIFGKKGKFDPEDLIEIILEKEETSRFIVKKIWKEFVSPNISKRELDYFSNVFKKNNYDIRKLFLSIFTSDSFYEMKNRGALIKSPIHFILSYYSFLKENEIKPESFDVNVIMRMSKKMGMELFNPPNVRGWTGHTSWINTNTLLLRKSLIRRFWKYRLIKRSNISFRKRRFVKNIANIYLPLPPIIDLKKGAGGKKVFALLSGPIFQLR